MKDILQEILRIVRTIMDRTANYQDDLSDKYHLNPNAPPIGAFGMINNYSLLTYELLDHYYLV